MQSVWLIRTTSEMTTNDAYDSSSPLFPPSKYNGHRKSSTGHTSTPSPNLLIYIVQADDETYLGDGTAGSGDAFRECADEVEDLWVERLYAPERAVVG